MSPVIALFIDIGSDIGAVTIDQCDDICLALIWQGDVWAVTAVTAFRKGPKQLLPASLTEVYT